MAEKDIKYLEWAAQTYYMVENLEEAKRIFLKLLGLQDPPKDTWMMQIIGICQAMEDTRGEEKYIRMALDYFPMEKKYWRYLANVYMAKEDYKGGTAAFEIATRVALPEQKTEWRTLIDLYNYLGLPLRSAESIQIGLDLLAKDSTEEEQQLAIADAYARGARVDKAIAYLDSVIAKAPSYALRVKKATILYEARRNEEAIAALDDCIAMKSSAYDAHFMKGWVAWDMKDWKMAKKAFGESVNSREDTIRYTSEDALAMLKSLDEAKSK
jgi:tetratricopeptide (TPR) repeat protein